MDEIYHEHNLDDYILSRDKTKRTTRIPFKYDGYVDINLIIYSLNCHIGFAFVPNDYKKVITCPNLAKWNKP